jgi:hypothetical protein
MLRNMVSMVIVAVFCTGCVSVHSEKRCTEMKSECPKACQKDCPKACPKECPKMLRHVVLFKFKDGTTPEKIKEVQNAFAALPGKIDVIKGFEMGTNVSVENHSEGLTHCFVVSFLDEAGRDAYLIHPAHKEFGQSLGGCLDKVVVADYWNK